MMYVDDYDNLKDNLEKKTKFKWKIGDLPRENNLMMNFHKANDTILKNQ